MIKQSARFIVGYLLLTLFICGDGLFFIYPWHPSTVLGWSLFLMIMPLLYFFLEFSGSIITSEKIESRKKAPYSWGQIFTIDKLTLNNKHRELLTYTNTRLSI